MFLSLWDRTDTFSSQNTAAGMKGSESLKVGGSGMAHQREGVVMI